MINHKIRQKPTSDKKYVAFLQSYGIKPLRTYEKNKIEYFVYDNRETLIYRIAYKALGD